jgi:competence protein ComEA
MKSTTVIFPVLALLGLCSIQALAGPVNINTADATALAQELKGVGPAKAAAIVDYRTKHGAFKTADELSLVKGIGQKLIDQNRANLRVDKNLAVAVTATRPAVAAAATVRK